MTRWSKMIERWERNLYVMSSNPRFITDQNLRSLLGPFRITNCNKIGRRDHVQKLNH